MLHQNVKIVDNILKLCYTLYGGRTLSFAAFAHNVNRLHCSLSNNAGAARGLTSWGEPESPPAPGSG